MFVLPRIHSVPLYLEKYLGVPSARSRVVWTALYQTDIFSEDGGGAAAAMKCGCTCRLTQQSNPL